MLCCRIAFNCVLKMDGYRLSTYFYKDRCGPITWGPVWDFNRAWGNNVILRGDETAGWVFDDAMFPWWWARLSQDPTFVAAVAKRWTQLRNSVWSDGKFHDSAVSFLHLMRSDNF